MPSALFFIRLVLPFVLQNLSRSEGNRTLCVPVPCILVVKLSQLDPAKKMSICHYKN